VNHNDLGEKLIKQVAISMVQASIFYFAP